MKSWFVIAGHHHGVPPRQQCRHLANTIAACSWTHCRVFLVLHRVVSQQVLVWCELLALHVGDLSRAPPSADRTTPNFKHQPVALHPYTLKLSLIKGRKPKIDDWRSTSRTTRGRVSQRARRRERGRERKRAREGARDIERDTYRERERGRAIETEITSESERERGGRVSDPTANQRFNEWDDTGKWVGPGSAKKLIDVRITHHKAREYYRTRRRYICL